MAHPQQAEFFSAVRAHYPASFDSASVLEVGSLDINGSVRELFAGGAYVGVDLQPGPGVDLACPGHLLEFPTGHFDTVISAECFEHNPYWRETFANMLRMCRPGGLVLVSCASTGRKEHGTTRTNPDASPFTVEARWDYYRNLSAPMLTESLHLAGWLSDWHCWVNHISRDLYFVGLRGADDRKLDATLVTELDARYALNANAKALRRGLKTKLLGDLLSPTLMSTLLGRLRRTARRAREIRASRAAGGPACATCGFAGAPLHRNVLWPELVAAWDLTPDWARWMDEREGSRCAWCGSSLRSQGLARAIVTAVNGRTGGSATRLRSLFDDPRARALAIAEINSAGNLHRHLARCPGLCYSEYGSTDPAVPSQDLGALGYGDASFDLVITSDTLEHVPDIDRALRETRRVLKPGACHVFTVPVVWNRPTRQRARIVDGRLEHLLPPSHHGTADGRADDFLVFHEFGADFPARCEAAGFSLELLRDPRNPALVTFVARNPP